MTTTVGRTLLAALAVVASAAALVTAQQPAANVSPSFTSAESLERIRAALQAQQPITLDGTGLFAPTTPDGAFFTPSTPDAAPLDRILEHPVILRLGALTFVTPRAGLFLDVRVPIGTLVTRAARSVADAQHRRSEKAAHAEVVKALAEFQNAQSK
jgi:hypothetical protein